MLLTFVDEKPGFCVEAIAKIGLIDDVIRWCGQNIGDILTELVGIDMHHAIDKMNIITKQVVGTHDSNNSFQRRRIAHRHLDRVKCSP